jgi:pimeloyl-ACP methyl ester carboxylesterase
MNWTIFRSMGRLSLSVLLLASWLLAQKRTALSTTPYGSQPSANTKVRALDDSSCPNQGGILDSISVPVGQPLVLYVLVGAPTTQDEDFDVSSDNSQIANAGDPTEGFLGTVTIPQGQQTSNPFTVIGNTIGQANIIIESLSGDYGTSSTPIGPWDVSPGADPNVGKFLDANPPDNPCRVPDSADLSTDPTVLSACGTPVYGTASDGVSQLLMRLVSGLAGTACYQITSTGPPDQGSIPTEVNSTEPLNGMNYGFSFYQSPDGFGNSDEDCCGDGELDTRTVEVQFSFTPSEGNGNTTSFTADLEIIRPPLMLIHGIWSKPDAWSGSWSNPGTETSLADYHKTNASSFSVNSPSVEGFVADALELARNDGYAATQADVVGHSMGGILTRLYVASSDFERVDNFNAGDVHRLVTLDTPHFGTSLANLAVSLYAHSVSFRLVNLVAGIFRGMGFTDVPTVTQGAACDLAENSPALQGLADITDIPSQVVTATGGPAGTASGGPYMEEPYPVQGILTFNILHLIYPFPQNVVNGFRFRLDGGDGGNDTVVPLTSQQDGSLEVPGLTGKNFPDLIHTTVNTTSEVSDWVLPLLDGPDSGFAASLPGVTSNGLGNPLTVPGLGSSQDQADYAKECKPGGPMNPTSSAAQSSSTRSVTSKPAAADSRVQVTAPTNGQHFAPGDAVTVTVQITAPLTAAAGFVTPAISGLGPIQGTNNTGSSYQASFVIPNSFAGPATITPDIFESNGNPIEGESITINVIPTTRLTSLRLAQTNFILRSIGTTAQLYVNGQFPGSVSIDLSSSVSGTTYESSNNDVITVNTQGAVQAMGFGTAVVTVTNNGLQAFATFVVENPVSPLPPQEVTAQLNVSASGFTLNRNTGFFVQTVQLSAAAPVVGPLYFVLTDVPAGIKLVGSGTTQKIQPSGSPYVRVPLPKGATLKPGTTITLTLQFLDSGRARINYTSKIFRTLATP